MKRKVYVGVDTDSRGSIAFLDIENGQFGVYLLPNTTRVINRKNRNVLDLPKLGQMLRETALVPDIQRVTLEDQSARPDQDAASTYYFGETSGQLDGGLHVAIKDFGDKVRYVRAIDWKNSMRLSSDKNEALALAARIFPEAAPIWRPGRKTLCTSAGEAMLIALYGAVAQAKLPTKFVPWQGVLLPSFEALK